MIMYAKDSSPTITKQVVNNIIDAMNDANVTVINIDTLQQIVAELANHYNRLVNEHPDIEAEIDVWCSDMNDNRSMWEVLRDTCVARGLL